MKKSRSQEHLQGLIGSVSQQLLALKRAASFTSPPYQQPPSLSLASSDPCTSPDRRTHRPRPTATEEHTSPDRRTHLPGPTATAISDQFRDCLSENCSSRDTWATEQHGREREKERDSAVRRNLVDPKASGQSPGCTEDQMEWAEQTVVRRVAKSNRIRLQDIVFDPIDVIAERMRGQPDELSEDLKAELCDILSGGGTGGGATKQHDELALLQKLLVARVDITSESLMHANRVQLELLVAIKTGIQAFLHPDISVTHCILVEILLSKRCRNVACQSQLPGEDCTCEICSSKSGFCNACMCTICSNFDFEVNTCRWIGCNFCAHWTHTDCALGVGHITAGISKPGTGISKTLFRCRACKCTSELLGWVKDVFLSCAADWQRDELVRELESVRRIFFGSEDVKGKRLYWKTEDLLDKLNTGVDVNMVRRGIRRLFGGLETEDTKGIENEIDKLVEPQEACSRIADVVQEAMVKMEAVAEDKARALKKARLAFETSTRELEDKKKELAGLEFERQQKEQEIEELETIVRLKEAEGDMFQMRSDEALQEAEGLQQLALARCEKLKEEYTSRYLKLRLHEAEAERCSLFEKMQLQEQSHSDSLGLLTMSKIQDVVKQVYAKHGLSSHIRQLHQYD